MNQTNEPQLHLRWHSHTLTFTSMLQDLHSKRSFADLTIRCKGGVVRAHKAVLSLSSPYLATVLGTSPTFLETPLLLPDTPVQDIQYLISFIYKGQVDVPQNHIASFLNTGKHLHVLGLEQGDRLVDSPCKSDESDFEEENVKDVSRNNNDGEKDSIPMNLNSEELPNLNIKSEIIKQEEEMDMDPKFTPEPTDTNGGTCGGKIDLNFYLQQAIQSASMPCPLCKKEFKSQSGLRDHIRLHTGERPFVCDFCRMNFARASHLKRHRRMHTGEKPFECHVCHKDFSRGDKLKDHLRRHEAEDKLTLIRNQIVFTAVDETENNGQDGDARMMNNMANVNPMTIPFSSSPNVSSSQNINPNTPMSVSLPTSLSENFSLHNTMLNLSGKEICETSTPPPKRLKSGGLNSIGNLAQMPQLMMSHPESLGPQMMGVASIGECILRPIN